MYDAVIALGEKTMHIDFIMIDNAFFDYLDAQN